jgi:hypothetical protein
MAKSRLRVRRLTLAPLSDTGIEGHEEQREEGDEENRLLWDKEQMARGMGISIFSGEGKHPRPHIHGVEPAWSSKFWASRDGEKSLVASDDEDIDVPSLVEEAIASGFTIDQLGQVEEELPSPSTGSNEVCTKLKKGSMSKKGCRALDCKPSKQSQTLVWSAASAQKVSTSDFRKRHGECKVHDQENSTSSVCQ